MSVMCMWWFPLIALAVLLDGVHMFYRLIRNSTVVNLDRAGEYLRGM